MIDSPALHDRSGFASVYHPVRMLGMVLFIILLRVIITRKLYNIRTFLRIFPGHIVRGKRHRRILQGIMTFYQFLQVTGDFLPALSRMGVINFIPDTPHQYTGMVSVLSDPAFHIPCRPFPEKPAIVIGCFRAFPHIKSFRDYQDSHFIRQFQETGSHHVMSPPHRINAHFF